MGEGFSAVFRRTVLKFSEVFRVQIYQDALASPSNLYTEYGEVKEEERKGVSMADEEKVETTEAADTKAAKKGKKKWPVVVGVVAVVIVGRWCGLLGLA